MRSVLITAFLLSVGTGFSSANSFETDSVPGLQTRYIFTLQDCLNYAYKNQDSLKNAAIDVKISSETVNETVGRGIPNISIGASAAKNVIVQKNLVDFSRLTGPSSGGPEGPSGPSGLTEVAFTLPWVSLLTAQATQLIFDASYLVGLRAVKVVKDLSIKAFTRTKIQVAVQVTKAFYNVLAAKERMILAESAVTRLSRSLKDIKALNKNGFAEKIDFQRIEVQYNNSLTVQKQSNNGWLVALYALKFQLGMPLEARLEIKGSADQVDLSPLVDTTSLPYAGRIEYSLYQSVVESDLLRWKNAKSALLPRLTASASYDYSYQNLTLGKLYSRGFPGSTVGINFSWNIFDGTQTIHRINESRFNYEKSKNNLHNLQRGLEFQIRTARISYTNNLEVVQNQSRNKDLARQVYNTAKIKYTEGVGSSLELSDAEIALRDADAGYVNSLLDVLLSKVDLDQALGTLK